GSIKVGTSAAGDISGAGDADDCAGAGGSGAAIGAVGDFERGVSARTNGCGPHPPGGGDVPGALRRLPCGAAFIGTAAMSGSVRSAGPSFATCGAEDGDADGDGVCARGAPRGFRSASASSTRASGFSSMRV